jgi:hypothetical protein
MQIASALKQNALAILGLSYAALNLDQCVAYQSKKILCDAQDDKLSRGKTN